MGKKVKKKPRSGQKEKRGSAPSQKTDAQQNAPTSTETPEDGLVEKERKACPHFDKGINLVKVSSKLSSAEAQHIRCEDCRASVGDRRANKGKGKQGKKKGGSSVDSKLDSKAIWVCLECGRFSCGGIGFPTISQSHAVRHARQTRHTLAIQFENLQLRWCFPCNTLIPVEKTGETGESKDALSDIVKLIKGRSAERVSVDVEDVWFGSGNIMSEIKLGNSGPFSLDGTHGYLVRGLVNLGNTCFFNSILQNLLAMDRLRDHYLELDGSIGPLTVSLKKILTETSAQSGLRNVINPRSFFGYVCAKAPQFRGYQQHDSHELLRCLLDGLCTEESSARKQISGENGTSISQGPTFIDAIFGGQLSSIISCLDCGHSSKVFEPFLDLSLPVPTKKPTSKSAQPISRAKKQKLPPKRSGRSRPKISMDGDPLASPSVPISPVDGVASCPLESSEAAAKQVIDAVDNSRVLKSTDQSLLTDTNTLDLSNQMTIEEIEKKPSLENIMDNSSWLDYLETDLSNEHDTVSKSNDIAAYHDVGEKDDAQIDGSLQDGIESRSQVLHGTVTMAGSSETSTWLHYLEPDKLLDDHDMASNLDDGSVNQNVGGRDAVQNDAYLINQTTSCTHSICAESSYSPGNSSENELPLRIQGSEVLLLPYKEEVCSNGEILRGKGKVSSSATGCETDALDFDGFGDLFNEPEIAAGPNVKPLSSDDNFQAETGPLVGNTSESDPDEVDNSDSQVSVENCLAYFTKPELLSNEHGWHCEKCSKALREQRRQSRKKPQEAAGVIHQNGVDDRVNVSPSSSGRESSFSSEVRSPRNGDIRKDVISSKVDYEDANSGKVHPILAASSFQESNGGLTEPSSDNCSVNESSKAGGADEVQQNESHTLAGGSELEESGDEGLNTESIKVKRDATKRILINKAPPILTIHLKRFSQDARGRLSKLNGHVDFRDTIDLRPYMDPRCKEMDEYKYGLVGVVEHLGTMRGGHYVAYVRGSKKTQNGDSCTVWYHASDAYVREVSLQEVLCCEAYILFYEKN